MADDPTGPALTKLINSEIKEVGKELEKYKNALRKVERAAGKPGTEAASAALKGAQTLMKEIVESHIVMTRLLGGVMDAQQAVRELREVGQKNEGQITLKDVGGAGILQIGPYGRPGLGPLGRMPGGLF
jgi:hypothetical protein